MSPEFFYEFIDSDARNVPIKSFSMNNYYIIALHEDKKDSKYRDLANTGISMIMYTLWVLTCMEKGTLLC
ncbi:hypothetical protein MASR2M78_10350 [Treponema sp.]